MRIFCRRGSISIFLSIILLPCLAFTGIMVDMANLHLSKAVVESAGDLAANAALANYDTIVEEVYGLFAMSQAADNPEEALRENLNRYFDDSLMASGLLTKEEAAGIRSDLLGDLAGELFKDNGEEMSPNFLKVQSYDFQASYLPDSSLANPEVLRNQIVEFMKYRGPAQVGLGLLDSLASFKKMNAQSKVADKKLEVTEAISELSKVCQQFYNSIVQYDIKMKAYQEKEKVFLEIQGIDPELFKTKVDELLYEIHVAAITYSIFEVDENKIKDIKFLSGSGNAVNGSTGVSGASDASSKLQSIKGDSDLNADIAKAKEKAQRIGEYLNESSVNMAALKDVYTIYIDRIYPNYVVPLLELKKGIEEEISDLRDEISDLRDDLSDAEDSDEKDDIRDDIDDLEDEIDDLRNLVDQINTSVNEIFSQISSKLETNHTAYLKKMEDARTLISTKAVEVGKIMEGMNTETKNVAEHSFRFFNGVETTGETAIRMGEKVKEKLGNVVSKNEDFKEGISEYGKKDNDEFYASMNSDAEKISKQFTKEDVDEILEQLAAAERYINNEADPMGVLKSLEYYEFYESNVLSNENGLFPKRDGEDAKRIQDRIINYIKGNEDYVNEIAGKLEISSPLSVEYLKSRFLDKVALPVDSVIGNSTLEYYGKQIGQTKHPVSDGAGGIKEINVPKFYTYLALTYGIKQVDSDTQKNVEGSMEMANNQSKDNAVGKPTDIAYGMGVFEDTPSAMQDAKDQSGDFVEIKGNSDEKQSSSMDQFSNMQGSSSSLLSVLSGELENVRDNFLITSYVMENFSSYANTKAEFKDKIDATTLTNFAISGENNAIYGCEVEYIIYGSKGKEASGAWFWKSGAKGPESNVSFAKRDIFAIRLMFNSIYALTDGQIDAETKPPALAIQAATAGYCPYQVAQVIIKLALGIAESAIDLQEILDGEKVALIKSKDTWTCSLQGLVEQIPDQVGELTKEAVHNATNSFLEIVNNTTEWSRESVNQVADEAINELNFSFEAKLMDCYSTISTIVTNEIEVAFLDMYTQGEVYTEDELKSAIDEKLTSYIETQSEPVATFLNNNKSKIYESIMGEVRIILIEVKESLKNEALHTLEVQKYEDLLRKLSDAQTSYISTMIADIRNEAEKMITEVSGEVTSLIKSEGDKISKDLSEQVSQKTSDILGEFFPSEKQTIDTDDGGISKANTVSNMLKFGYDDYLCLFLFLALTNPSESNNTVLRIADVIQLNTRKGFPGGVEGGSFEANGKFKMSDAYTYVEVKTDVKVKPLLLSEKLFTNDIMSPLEYFKYDYKTIVGY